jgi:DNA processing protein
LGEGSRNFRYFLSLFVELNLPLWAARHPERKSKQKISNAYSLEISVVEDLFYWLALSLTPGIGSVLIKRLLERFKTPEAVFRAPFRGLLEIEGLGEKVAQAIRNGPLEKLVEKELSLIHEVGGKIVTLKDDSYPRRLKDIYDPPALLYVRGELKKED